MAIQEVKKVDGIFECEGEEYEYVVLLRPDRADEVEYLTPCDGPPIEDGIDQDELEEMAIEHAYLQLFLEQYGGEDQTLYLEFQALGGGVWRVYNLAGLTAPQRLEQPVKAVKWLRGAAVEEKIYETLYAFQLATALR